MVRIIYIAFIQLLILWIFGQPEHTGFWSAVYNGITILGRIIMFLFEKPLIWFPSIISTKYMIGFVLGCLITAGAVFTNDNDD